MSLDLIKKEGYNAELKLVIPAGDFEKYCNEAYNKNKSKINIPGFRKGKVPKNMIDKYYGEGFFYEDAINMGFSKEYSEGVDALSIEPVARPEIDVEEIKKGQDIVINVKVVIKPDITVENYKGLEISFPKTDVTEKEIDEELESMRNKNARYVTIEDRAVKDKDIIRLDFEGKKDGVPFDGGKAENYSLIIGSKSFIEGFEEQLIGMNLGEEKVINVTFPQDYMEKTLAGAEVTFNVRINEIQEKQLPELDDEFVKDVSEFDTLDELREDIKKSIQSRKEAKAVSEFENEIIDTIVKNTSMDLPVEMIDSEVEHMMNEFSQGLAYQGMDINMYLGYINKTADDLKNEMRGEAEKRVKGSMVLEKIRDIENISYQEEQLEDELAKMAKQYNMDLNKLKEILPEEQKQYIIDSIRTKNTIDFLNKQTKRV